MIQPIDRKDLISGCVLGLAIGDALGVSCGMRKAKVVVEPVADILGGGPFELNAGEWTGDTSMAMCLAESLLSADGFSTKEQMRCYGEWFDNGFWSCRDFCFGMEDGMRQALLTLRQGGTVQVHKSQAECGGFLSRLAPVVLYFLRDTELLLIHTAQSVQLTHPLQVCVDSARYFAILLQGALLGIEKERLLSPDYVPSGMGKEGFALVPEIEQIRLGNYREKPVFKLEVPYEVVSILQSALWAFAQSSHFKDGALKAVNLGGKSSTVGAIYGQLAGAYYGAEHMPDNWVRKLAHRDALEKMAERLWRSTLI